MQQKALQLTAGKVGQTSYTKILQERFGIVKKFYKQEEGLKDKGMFSPAEDGSYIITLFKGADASTVIHETGHYFVETMINEALADPSNARLNADAKNSWSMQALTLTRGQAVTLKQREPDMKSWQKHLKPTSWRAKHLALACVERSRDSLIGYQLFIVR